MRNLLTYFLCLIGFFAISQNKQILYGFDEIPQSLLVNPGTKVDQEIHIGIPLLSQIHLNGGSTGVSVYDIFQEGDYDINSRILNRIHKLNNSDFLTATAQLELLSFGWRSRKGIYFSGGIYQEMDFLAYFPRDLAILAVEGNRDYIGKSFNFGEVSATGDLTTVYHFGYNKLVNDRLTVGARVKLYSSVLSFRSVNNTGYFSTHIGEDNIYQHTIQNADLTFKTSGYRSLKDLDGKDRISKILGRSLFGGNLGIGLDFGFTYDLNNSWKLSASALDVGAIFNSKDVESYRVHGSYTLDGINLLFPGLDEGEPTFPYYDYVEDEIDAAVFVDTLQSSFVQFRPLKLNASLSYGFGRYFGYDGCNCLKMAGKQYHKHNVGLHLYSIFRPKGPQGAATLFYRRKFTDYFSAKVTYTADSYSFTNVGLGVSSSLGNVNFYVAADNLLRYGNLAKAKNLSLQLGFNIKIE